MNYEALNAQLTQAINLKNIGNFDEAEKIVHEVLAELEKASGSIENQTASEGESLYCSALITLSALKWQRGDLQMALTLAHTSLGVVEKYTISDLKAKAFSNCGNVYQNLSEYANALEYYQKSLAINEELGRNYGVASNLGNIGLIYWNLSDYAQALIYLQKALAINEEIGRKNGIASNLGNIGLVYWNLLDYAQALTYYHKALAINEEIGNKYGIVANLGNCGSVYQQLTDYAQALTYYQRALAINQEIGRKKGIASNLGNCGNVYWNLSDYSKALSYLQQSLAIYEEIGSKDGIARDLGSIGNVFATKAFDGYDASRAEECLRRAMAISNAIGSKTLACEWNKSLAELYKVESRWKEAHEHLEKYITLEKEVQSEEAHKQANLMEQRRQAAEREKQIAIAKAAADAKHQATEQLLHNVLPPSIANKMLDGTKLIAEKLPSVSVLFADIVNFTKLSQRITPEELVDGLDRIFSTFDALAEKYKLEKIKTIGDAYMVVSGAPIQRKDHAEAMAHFALEMVEAMKEFRSISTGEEIQLRIGIHSGEVVAGVIGKKKFAYDLWGDAVNTASRMESHGEAGKIHVSEEFMRALSLSSPTSPMSLRFQERGEMHIKGKGMMKTYFLENRSKQ